MTGTQQEFAQRIRATLPPWFGDDSPVVSWVLNGLANASSFVYSLLEQARLQTRIRTATGGFLDMISGDFFAINLPRLKSETDIHFRIRILLRLFQEKTTLRGLAKALVSALNIDSVVIDANSNILTDSTGAIIYDSSVGPSFVIYEKDHIIPNGAFPVGIKPEDAAARYGSTLERFEALVIIGRVGNSASGYNNPAGGYDSQSYLYYIGSSVATPMPIDKYLYDIIDDDKPVATTVWVALS